MKTTFLVALTALLSVSDIQGQAVSDSDAISFEPWIDGQIHIPQQDTQFVQSIIFDSYTPMLRLTVPLDYSRNGTSWPTLPDLTIDTSVSEDSGIRGITFGPSGSDSIWSTRNVVVDNVNQTLVIRFESDTLIVLGQRNILCVLHWQLTPTPTTFGQALIDTACILGQCLRITTQADVLIPTFSWGAIFFGHVGAAEPTKPDGFTYMGNYPNPFNASTQISYTLQKPSSVTLAIYDALGRHVATLLDGVQSAGKHSVIWNGTNDRGQTMGSGVYFYQLSAGAETSTRRMLLLK